MGNNCTLCHGEHVIDLGSKGVYECHVCLPYVVEDWWGTQTRHATEEEAQAAAESAKQQLKENPALSQADIEERARGVRVYMDGLTQEQAAALAGLKREFEGKADAQVEFHRSTKWIEVVFEGDPDRDPIRWRRSYRIAPDGEVVANHGRWLPADRP